MTFGEPVTYFVVIELTGDAPNHTPYQFRVTHVTAGSTAQDRDHDLPLALEFASDVASGFCAAMALVPPDGVVIGGPLAGTINAVYTFTATVSPLTITQPITYAWQATAQSPVTHTGRPSDIISFTWSASGAQAITVTATNAYGTVTATHVITTSLPPDAVPVGHVTINGPLTGDVNVAHTFSAAVSPLTATQPITYAWQATAQSPVTHTNGLSDTINFSWSESGTHTITATASNAYGMVTDTHTITISLPPEAVPVAGVTINGPLAGDVNVAHTFSAAVSPLTATQPITYAWQATGQSPVTHTGGLSDTVSFIWSASDTQAIIVTASNAYSAVTSIHTITLDPPVDGDAYELDDSCAQARSIPTDDAVQVHTFHDEGDGDWVKFQAQAGKTFVIKVDNVGADVDAVIMLYDACGDAPVDYGDNAFGRTVRMEWDCAVDGEYYLKLMQHDPSVYGEDTYDLSVAADAEPPSAPRSVRATPAHEALVVQWQRSPERDAAGYIVRWGTHPGGPYSGVDGVDGADSTYYRIADLTNGIAYYIVVQAWDFSDNESGHSWEIGDIPVPNPDATQPSIAINRPSAEPVYTTTVDNLTIRGDCADSGDNLSRVWVRNVTNGAEGWDYSLSGKSDVFDVESVPLVIGDNQIEVTVYDAVGNTGSAALTIHRLAGQNGAVVIVGGHDESYRLQTRIDYATRRAYNVFRGAGFGPEDIYYLSPTPQDADGDGFDDVTSTPAPANVHAALRWAADRVGPGVPFFLYMMDHGQIEGFCADGCAPAGQITSQDLDAWLSELEASSGGDQVNVIIEACHSGSFVDRAQGIAKSISRNGRVVIASTGRTNLAYASAQGAYFSDAFFSAVANSNSLLDSFDHAKTAIEVTGNDQTPWLDDNGDGLYTPADGAFAAERYVASFFGSLLPRITETSISRSGAKGTITARVERGDGPMDLVWAVVYAPSFHEPISNTMELGVPLIKLEPDEEQEEVYVANYNGFIEEGIYRVVIYAADDAGNQALPKRVLMEKVFLPLALKDHVSASPTRSSGDGEVLFGSKSVITTIPASPPWLQYTLPKEPTLERPRLSRFEPGPRRRWDDQWHK